MGGTAMNGYYSTWIEKKVGTFQTNLQVGLNNMINWWIQRYDNATPPEPTQMVKFDYACNYNKQAAGTVPVDNATLKNILVQFMTQNLLNWIPNLLV
jgi:hypothetical protein